MKRKQTTPNTQTAPKAPQKTCGSCAQNPKKAPTLTRVRVTNFIDGYDALEIKTQDPEKKVTVSADLLRMLHLGIELEATRVRRQSLQLDALKEQVIALGGTPVNPCPTPAIAQAHYLDMDESVALVGQYRYAGQPGMSVQTFLDRLSEEEGIYIGNHDFYAFLRREGYICKVDGTNVITEKADYMKILTNGSPKSPGSGQGIWLTASGCDYLKDRLEELHKKMRQAKPAQEAQEGMPK